MKRILTTIFLLTLFWSCNQKPAETLPVAENLLTSENTQEPQVKYELNYSSDTAYAEFIHGLTKVINEISLGYDSLTDEYFCDVDFESYFKIFDKLSIAEKWKLESHYRHFGDAGRPLLLAFEQGDKLGDSIQLELNRTFEETKYKGTHEYTVSKKLFSYQDSVNYLNCIRIANNKMGYFQFVVFALIGDNYCQFWHSNYGEMSIITTKEELKQLTERKDDFYYRFSSNSEEEMYESMDIETVLQIDPTPSITISDDQALVKMVTLSPWTGFLEETFSVSRAFPHKLERVKLDTLIPYNCGIMF